MNHIDLHMHTKHSIDGEKEVQEIIDQAKENNISMIALTDHNCVEAYEDSFDLKGISLVPGIEVDCTFHSLDFHILGYGIDVKNPVWKEIHTQVNQMEKDSGLKRLEIIRNQMGILVDQEELERLRPNGIFEAETVCEVALKNPKNKENPYLKEFYPGGAHSVSPYVDFFWEYCAKGKLAYSPMEFISMEDIIDMYRKQNAAVILAHPGNNVHEDTQLLEDIINLGIDGLEVYSSYHSKEQIVYYKEACIKHNLKMTAGSDFHGKTKPHIQLGQCSMPLEEEPILKDWISNYCR